MEKERYLVSEWALIRRNELVDIPDQLVIHADFLQTLTREEFESAFREIGRMFWEMYSHMAETPEAFGLPCIRQESMTTFQSRPGRPDPRPGICFIFSSACLPAGISGITDLLRIRRQSQRSTGRKRQVPC